MSFSIKEWQKVAITRFLISDKEFDNSGFSNWASDWKVLIFDAECRNIITPLFSVNELRNLSISLHLDISSNRDPIPEAPAVYLLKPTPENVQLVVNDASIGKYAYLRVNFVPSIPRPILETFARSCVQFNAAKRIKGLCDQYIDFISLEHRLFTFNMRNSYLSYNHPRASENDGELITKYTNDIASRLVSVFGVTRAVPLIIYSPGGPSELVAQQLNKLLRDQLSSSFGGIFGNDQSNQSVSLPNIDTDRLEHLGATGQRPTLLLLDREIDMIAPLVHGSSYLSLVDDTLGPIGLNKIFLPDKLGEDNVSVPRGGLAALKQYPSDMSLESLTASIPSNQRPAGKFVVLNADTDPFWRHWAGTSFPDAIEAQDRELKRIVEQESKIKNSTATGVSSAMGTPSAGSDLISTINSLPELTKRKAQIQQHLSLLSAIHKIVDSRLMYEFTEVENGTLKSGGGGFGPEQLQAVLALLKNPAITVEDKVRLSVMLLVRLSLTTATTSHGGVSDVGGHAQGLRNTIISSHLASEPQWESQPPSTATLIEKEYLRLSSTISNSFTNAGSSNENVNNGTPPELSIGLAALKRAKDSVKAGLQTSSLSFANPSGFGGSTSNASVGTVTGLLTNLASNLSGISRLSGDFISKAAHHVGSLLHQGHNKMVVGALVQELMNIGNQKSAHMGLSLGGMSIGKNKSGFSALASALMTLDPHASIAGAAAPPQPLQQYLQSHYSVDRNINSANIGFAANASTMPGSTDSLFRSLFVFMVGGGSYEEAQDVWQVAQSLMEQSSGKSTQLLGSSPGESSSSSSDGAPLLGGNGVRGSRAIVYGATEMMRPAEFLKQLAVLGSL